jgi:hypothetical protein
VRSFGGSVGAPIYPTRTKAAGVFRLNDVSDMIAEDRWPTVQDPLISKVMFVVHGSPVLNANFPLTGAGTSSSANFFSSAAVNATDKSTTGGPFAFGGNSFLAAGAAGGMSIGFATLGAVGPADFTIEGWFRLGTVPSTQTCFDIRPPSNNGLYPTIFFDTSNKLNYFTNSATKILTATTYTSGVNYFVAYVRSGGNLGTLSVNGVSVGTWADSTSYVSWTRCLVSNASFGAGSGLSGGSRYDEMRLTVGTGGARYTSYPFTPPTQRFPDY